MTEAVSRRTLRNGEDATIFFCIERCKKESKFLDDSILCYTFALPFKDECCCSSVVEHFLGKEEVTSSSLVNSSNTVEVIRTDNLFSYVSAGCVFAVETSSICLLRFRSHYHLYGYIEMNNI